MELTEIPVGETHTLRLVVEGARSLPELRAGTAVELQREEHRGRVLARVGSVVVAVAGADAAQQQRLEAVVASETASLAHVLVGARSNGGATVLMVSVTVFPQPFRWREPLAIAVTERAVESVREATGERRLDLAAAQAWLEREFLLPPSPGADGNRAIVSLSVHEDPTAPRSLRLHGRQNQMDLVVTPADQLEIRRLRLGHIHIKPEWRVGLVIGNISFADGTVAGRIADEIKGELTSLAVGGGPYLQLWSAYLEGEKRQLAEQARALGAVPYRRFESLGHGVFRFEVARDDEGPASQLLEFTDEVELEAVRADEQSDVPEPIALDDDEPSSGLPKVGAAPGFVGLLDQQALRRGRVELRTSRRGGGTLPPPAGVLRLSLRGDLTVLRRRERAMEKIRTSQTPMRQLGLILEDRYRLTIGRTRKHIDPNSARVAAVVGGTLTPPQRRALDIALNTPDLALIQGPPGTGKTRVIAALQQRLAEEASKSDRLTGRVLLTSFQHEAVDNVVAAAQVFGLPAMKVGESRRARDAKPPFERWREQQADRVRSSLKDLGFEIADVHRRVRTLARGYLRLPGSPGEAADLLERVLALATDHLSPALDLRIRDQVRRMRSAQRLSTGLRSDEMLAAVRLVRALRTDRTSFEDDGPMAARRAAQWLAELGLDGVDDTVQALRVVARQPQWQDDLGERLRTIKADLLDRLLAPADAPPLLDGEVASLLEAAVAELSETLRRSPAGLPRALATYLEDLESDPELVHETLKKYSSVVAATCQHAASRMMREVVADGAFETVIVDEAARANPLDLFIPMTLGKDRIVLVGDHRQLPHLIEHELERTLEERLPDLQAQWRESLFERLFKRVLRELEQRDGVPRVVTLDTQFRMHETLGRFVSQQFYEIGDEADWVRLESGRPASDFVHALPGYEGRVASWLDVPLAAGPERPGISKHRPIEAQRIAAELKRLMDDPAGAALTFGVIAFYRRQVQELEEALCRLGVAERSMGRLQFRDPYREHQTPEGRAVERLRVGTVDEFQGREFDVVFVSLTRSNPVSAQDPASLRRKYGHLMLPNRMCVAMSRQRRLLILAGDRGMLAHPSAPEVVPALVAFEALAASELMEPSHA